MSRREASMNRWSPYTREESRLAKALNIIALILIAISILTLIAPYLFPVAPLFIAPPFFVSNTIAGLALMSFLAWFSAGDVRRFRAMIYVLIGGFLIGAAAFLSMQLRPIDDTQVAPLLIGFIICVIGALVVALLMAQAKTPVAPWL